MMAETRDPVPLESVGPAAPAKPRARWAVRLAIAYLVVVVAVFLATRGVAERWWLTTLLLYVPQVLYLAPCAVTVPLALLLRDGLALRVNAAAAVVVAGLMMG